MAANIIEDQFSKLIGKSIRDTREIINRLTYRQHATNVNSGITFFSDHASTLKSFTVDSLGGIKGTLRNAVRTEVGSGSYGTVYLLESGNVLKEIILRPGLDEEDQIYKIYLELFIQLVLSNDPTVGQYIPKITSFASNIVRRGRSAANETPRTATFYIIMEKVKYDFDDYIKEITNKYTTKITIEDERIRKPLVQLCDLLTHLYGAYEFRHNDMHGGNIMITDAGDVRLIDFGFSRIRYNRNLYATNDDLGDIERLPSDLLIFLTSFVEFYMIYSDAKSRVFEASHKTKFRQDIFNYYTGTCPSHIDDFFLLAKSYADSVGSPIFHTMYYDSTLFTDENLDIMQNQLRFVVPENFKQYLQDKPLTTTYEPPRSRRGCAIMGGRRTRKMNRTKKRTKRTKRTKRRN